jgi:hypothetical protein
MGRPPLSVAAIQKQHPEMISSVNRIHKKSTRMMAKQVQIEMDHEQGIAYGSSRYANLCIYLDQ